MAIDPVNPQVLVSVPGEVEAAVIVNALEEHGIGARATGGYTSGFKAEAPGEVRVLVAQADAVRAKDVLTEIRREYAQIDWSNVDFGNPEESNP